MPKITAICFLFSLSFYGIGNSKMWALKNSIGYVNTDDSIIQVSLTICYFVLTIFFAAIGFVFYYTRDIREPEVSARSDIETVEKSADNSEDRRHACILLVKTQVNKSTFDLELDKRLSS